MRLPHILRLLGFLCLSSFAVLLLWQPITLAQDQSPVRVGLIVMGLQEGMATACIVLDKENPTSYDVLLASGLEISASVGTMGSAVCKIDNIGCAYPGESCFCQCSGSRCSYWAYYYREEDTWRYSQVGASSKPVKSGDVDLWLWNDYRQARPALPDLTWQDICPADVTVNQKIRVAPAEKTSQSDNLAGYIVFGFTGSVLVGVIIWRRLRSRSS